jgi:acyl-coenzyme A thioesterase PaaI-like protein
LCGIDGVVHGGIITLVLEEVAQWTIISHFGKFGMTREVSVRYLQPVSTNMEILVEAEIVNQKEKIFNSVALFIIPKAYC